MAIVRRIARAGLVVAMVATVLVAVGVPEASAGTTINPSSLTAGFWGNCALDPGGQVLCWGRNDSGQLGDGTTTDRATAAPVAGISDASAVSAGQDHACAIVGTGSVKCWGENDEGQLGDGTSGNYRTSPVTVPGLTDVVKLAMTWNNTCALRAVGEVRCWGFGGVNGDGTYVDRLSPVAVLGLPGGVTDIAGGDAHFCAIGVGADARCWGNNDEGQARGAVGPWTLTAAVIPGVAGVTGLGIGQKFSCVLVGGGAVKCWGTNGFGELGDGTGVDSPSAVDVTGVSGATQVAGGYRQACAVLGDEL